jgi:membrane-bound lytic murein transglycosylase MltF
MEKKYFNSQRYGYGMIDETQNYIKNIYTKYKPCNLVLDNKEIVPKEDESNDKAYQYKYTYKIVPLKGKFIKIPDHKPFINNFELIDEYVVYYEDD